MLDKDVKTSKKTNLCQQKNENKPLGLVIEFRVLGRRREGFKSQLVQPTLIKMVNNFSFLFLGLVKDW